MTSACPNGHQSEWPDWCSVCGERLGEVDEATRLPMAGSPVAADPADPADPPMVSGPACDNCGVARNEHDVFCESCGYDFASGSLPEQSATRSESAAAEAAPPMHVRVSIDEEFFAASVGDVDLALPDQIPSAVVVPLAGTRILIGRQSTSRGIFPEIDVLALTEDPAVSSRHAMLERAADGTWTFTDLGSTNGSFLSPDANGPIEAGVALPVDSGASFFIGAWTRLQLLETS